MEQNNKTPNVIVETFADDMVNVLENDKEGTIKKIIEGIEKEEAEKKYRSPESKQNKIFMISSIALLVLGAATLAFFIYTRGPKTVPVEKQFTPIIFNDKTSFIEISGLKKDEIEQIILNKVNSTAVKKGGIEGIYPTVNKQVAGLREFLALIKSSFTLPKEEVLVSNNFLMGVVNVEKEPEITNRPGFFLLIKVRTIADIFPAMRAWEEKMFFDLHGFLGFDLNSSTSYLLTKSFEDGIVENKNARFLYDKENKLVLMYVFADDNSAVITNSENALNEIILRLASTKIKQ